MFVKCILFVFFFGFTWAQQTDFAIPENFSLPPELEGKIDPDQLKGIQNQTLSTIQKKCEKNGGPGAYENSQKAAEDFKACVQNLVDVDVLTAEIEKASPNGQVDEVFKEYCEKTPDFKQCFTKMTETTKVCLSPPEQENLKTVYNVTEQLAEFICFKQGDRIALFISEGGRECFQEKQTEIQNCANSTFATNFPSDPSNWSPESIPNIAFGEEECAQLSALQLCVVGALEACPKPTTANIVDSMFNFVRKATPCNVCPPGERSKAGGGCVRTHKQKPGSATGLAVTSATLLVGLFASMLL